VVDILIEDTKHYAEALQCIWRLEPATAYPVLMKYTHSLIEHCPQETTKLFIEYYTGRYAQKKDVPAVSEVQAQTGGGAFKNLSALWTLPFMNRSSTTNGAVPLVVISETTEEVDEPADESLAYTIPRPRSAFSSFLAHPAEFVTFLEALVLQDNLSKADKSDLSTTLVQMYLESANDAHDSAEKEKWQVKAIRLITDNKITRPRPLMNQSLTPRTCCFCRHLPNSRWARL